MALINSHNIIKILKDSTHRICQSLIIITSGALILFTIRCKKENDSNLIKDIEGNIYKTVTIGKQIWMAENLKTSHFNDGTLIPNVTTDINWGSLTTPAYCWYNNDEAVFKNTYGALYNWYAVNTGKLCPSGWHVPSLVEWDTLMNFLGGYLVAGYKMKETGTTHWLKTDSNVTNESGFSALPGGCRTPGALFRSLGSEASFWSATEFDINYAWQFFLSSSFGSLHSFHPLKTSGASVRCIKD